MEAFRQLLTAAFLSNLFTGCGFPLKQSAAETFGAIKFLASDGEETPVMQASWTSFFNSYAIKNHVKAVEASVRVFEYLQPYVNCW